MSSDILSIENDSETVAGLISELKLQGLTVDYAKSIVQARQQLQKVNYDLLLVDLLLPEKEFEIELDYGGLEIMKELKSGKLGDLNSATPFIVVTVQDFRLHRLMEKMGELSGGQYNIPDWVDVFGKGRSIFPMVEKIQSLLGKSDNAQT